MEMGSILGKMKVYIKENLKMENITALVMKYIKMDQFLKDFSQMVKRNMDHMNLKMVVSIKENLKTISLREKVNIVGQLRNFMTEIGRMEK